MTLPNNEEVQTFARKHVLEANENGVLHTLTPKLIRRQIETELNLQEGDLDSSQYKDVVKEAITTTMEEIGSGRTKKAAHAKQKVKKRASDAETEIETKPKKKPRTSKKGGATNSGKRKAGSTLQIQKVASPSADKSVPTPDTQNEEDSPASPGPPHKHTRKVLAHVEEPSDEESGDKDEPQLTTADSNSTSALMLEPQGNVSADAKDDIAQKMDCQSDSELSVLIDEPPKQKQKSNTDKKKATNTKSTTKGTKGNAGNMSKDEERIKKLKSLVVACGVRKVWSKVFQGLDSPPQQIKKLKEILGELGMKGRMSVEQAKAIREKREFAQELEDVQEFEKAVIKSGRKRGAQMSTREDESGEEESEEEVDPKRRRRKMNAAQSITAFLGDQSSDDD